MLPNPTIREANIHDFLKIFRKNLLLIFAFVFIATTIVTIYVFVKQPVYRATVSILIQKSQLKLGKGIDDAYQQASDIQFYQTQYKVLASRMLAERVYEELKLSKDPAFKDSKDPALKIQKMLKIEPVRNSNVALIHIEDTDSLRAAAIANTLAKSYINYDIEIRNRAIKEATGWLESQLEDIKKKVRSSEEALNKYVQENRIVSIPDIDKKNEAVLEGLKSEKVRIEAEIANDSKRYKSKHPKMIALVAKLEQVDLKTKEETDKLLSLNEKMVQYNLLKKEVESNQQLYTTILARSKETGVAETMEASSITIIDPAKPSEEPFKPKKAQSIALAFIFSLFGGFGLVMLLEYLDSSIRTAEDVSHYLDLPFLGYVPSVDTKDAKTDNEKAFVSFQKGVNPTLESYRALRTSILFSTPEDRPLKTLLITSSIPAEGKSFVATNLASVFSQMNERVLLIDIDMRKPKLYKLFNIEQKPGISAFLTGSASLESVIRPTAFTNLSIMTSGAIPPNPSELLSSGMVVSLFKDLGLRFDRIVIDAPPVLSIADTPLLANRVDGVMLVIKGASTRLEAIISAKKRVLEAKGKIIGAVVNNILPQKEDRYYYYHYYYAEGSPKQKKA